LREQAPAVDPAAGAVPEADAGVTTEVIENAIGALLSQIGLLSSALIEVADNAELAALDYHQTDLAARSDLARLLMPGATDREIADAVERSDRASELDLAQLLLDRRLAHRPVMPTARRRNPVARRRRFVRRPSRTLRTGRWRRSRPSSCR
jgi:hypothetical protein